MPGKTVLKPRHPQHIPAAAAGSVPPTKPRRPRGTFDDLPRLADLVKRVYTLERRLLESRLMEKPSCYTPTADSDEREENLELPPREPVWERVAGFLDERRIGPIDYIARQFDGAAPLHRPLYPTHLLGDVAWKRYNDSKATKQAELQKKLHTYVTRLKSGVGSSNYLVWHERDNRDQKVESCLSVLYCDTSLSPLFIYCMAGHLSRMYPAYAEDAAGQIRRHEEGAAVEYVRFREDYDTAWGELIPAGFRPTAEAIYKRLLDRLF